MRRGLPLTLLLMTVLLGACGRRQTATETSAPSETAAVRSSILLVTLDTTRANSVQPESSEVETPTLAALATAGVRFTQAYSTAPQTLPAHTSILSGEYPAQHGVHENARHVSDSTPLLAERLTAAGYRTAAFVSGYPLERQFGLARGFQHYDDEFGKDAAERRGDATSDRAIAYLDRAPAGPLFLWVHYYDPHDPYAPPEPFKSRYEKNPYLGEIAFMDQQLGRVISAFRRHQGSTPYRIVVVGDHGEGRGDHGEMFHGDLLYQGVIRVPLVVSGPGVQPEVRTDPVSTRHIFDTALAWAGLPAAHSLMTPDSEPVLAEAMKPYLQYGWQPQVMGVEDHLKLIRSGDTEIYDLHADPGESNNLSGALRPPANLVSAVRDYKLPGADQTEAPLSEDARRKLASLGYVAWSGRPTLRADAPDPKDMTAVFSDLDVGSGLFARGRYSESISHFERVLRQDPNNLMVTLRLAVAHSLLGQADQAMDYFERARKLEPGSVDVRQYLGLHFVRMQEWSKAAPLLETVVEERPKDLPALEGLAQVRVRQGRVSDAISLFARVVELKSDAGDELVELGELNMSQGNTDAAIQAFERAQAEQGSGFDHDLELGVLYLAAHRFVQARDALDRVSSNDPGYPMALFKRAQVSVLLNEPDRGARIRAAYEHADSTTRSLIEREALFRGVPLQ